MSDASERGRSFEVKVQNLTRRKLHLEIKRDKQSGAGLHKQDIRDRYDELPIFIECKDQKSLKPREWWRVADGKSSVGQAPIVVFPDDEEVLCVMRYSDLLQFIKEGRDWHDTAEELRCGATIDMGNPHMDKKLKKTLAKGIDQMIAQGAKTCRAGHIADEYGYCNIRDCQYSRGYRKPKVKK